MTTKKRNILLISILVFLMIGAGAFFYIHSIISTKFNNKETVYIYIDESKDYENIIRQIKDSAKVENVDNFKMLALYLKYPENIKSGRYAITPGMDIRQTIRILQTGQQSPVKLTFNNIRTKENLAERISQQLMLDEKEFYDAINNPANAEKFGLTNETFGVMFIPNTYEIYWDISIDNFLERMNKEYNRFWTEERKKKASNLGLTPVEVSKLASIVEEECYFTDECPTVAGLYLNRLKRGQLLQADPTVKYAVGDFSLKRVLNKHVEVDSPYNTYKYAGLPPGPIRIPSIKGIDAVLNPQTHNYLYMCAKEDFSGRHNFAVTHAEHARNAAKYHRALNQRRIFE